MELIIGIVLAVLIGWVISKSDSSEVKEPQNVRPPSNYRYSKKPSIMTPAEESFFKRLETVASDRYYVFPQIHVSSLMKNETYGRYEKAGFQRINRRSVDFILCDRRTLKTVYAVELDDYTHDWGSTKHRDEMVEEMLSSVNIPLVRFRDVAKLSDEDIANRFSEAKQASSNAS